MACIAEIPGINGPTLELFRAAGIETSAELLELGPEELLATLTEANAKGNLLEELPSRMALESWQMAARILEGTARGGSREMQIPSSVMARARVAGLPVAKMVPSQQLRAAGITPSSVPIGRLVEQVAGGLRLAETGEEEPAAKRGDGGVAEPANEAVEQPVEAEESAEGHQGPKPLFEKPVRHVHTAPVEREATPLRFPKVGEERKTQDGVERRNHGMSHKEPTKVFLGALATLLSMLLMLAGFGTIAWFLTKAFYQGEQLSWEALLLLVFPLAAFIYLGFAVRARCRLCGQRLFLPRQCHKHQRAHRSIFGFLFAMSVHVIVRGWFRCMLCGTKQRLKE